MSTSSHGDHVGSGFRTWIPASVLGTVFSLLAFHVSASTEAADPEELADLSLEELAGIRVVSASKSAQTVGEAPASVYVITERDIRRSGATTLPEALRLAPNLHVARADGFNYAISARGFNNVRANKMLIMIDGRTIYSPLFSGVFWGVRDVVLEDLDRVEVVSGPGGTVWGANAVNGVINIISRPASETQGGLVSVGASDRERHGVARYGDSLGADGHYRVYAKYSRHDDTYTAHDINTETGWERTRAGFRADWDQYGDTLTLQGDAFTSRLHQFGADDIEMEGANILGRKNWTLSPDSALRLQSYYEHVERDQPEAFRHKLDTLDLELEHKWTAIAGHTIVWGGGYRYAKSRIDNLGEFAFRPDDRDLHWGNVFVQDQVALRNDLKLTFGIKLEDSTFTDWEAMPSVQLAWEPDPGSLVWSSLSRAVRSPSIIDVDFFTPGDPPLVDGVPQYEIAGGREFEEEIADVLELGYRSQTRPDLSWSITAFYTEYDDLRTSEPNPAGSGVVFRNNGSADSYGMEGWATWQLRSNWRVRGGLVVQRIDMALTPESESIFGTAGVENGDPDYHGILRSSYDLSDRVQIDATLTHVAELEAFDVPAYTSMDLRVGWTVTPNLELSVVGKNLLDDRHPEFNQNRAPGVSEFERTVYAKLEWRP